MWLETIALSLAGGFIYRWRGSDWWKPSRPCLQALFAIPYAVVAFKVSWIAAVVVFLLTTLALCMGHGNFMDLGSAERGKDERIEFLIKWVHGKIPEFWYDAMGLALTGLVVTIPCGVASLNPLIVISGTLKAPAYMIGYFLHRKGFTEYGEVLTGAFLWGILPILVNV